MIALRYEDLIAKRMKERQIAWLKKGEDSPFGPNGPNGTPTRTRAELAKIAGTSQGSVQRSKSLRTKRSTAICRTGRLDSVSRFSFMMAEMAEYALPSLMLSIIIIMELLVTGSADRT
jgi:hypothetical protein